MPPENTFKVGDKFILKPTTPDNAQGSKCIKGQIYEVIGAYGDWVDYRQKSGTTYSIGVKSIEKVTSTPIIVEATKPKKARALDVVRYQSESSTYYVVMRKQSNHKYMVMYADGRYDASVDLSVFSSSYKKENVSKRTLIYKKVIQEYEKIKDKFEFSDSVLPKEEVVEVPEDIKISSSSGIELILKGKDKSIVTKIGDKEFSSSEEEFARILKDLKKTKKTDSFIKDKEEIVRTPRFGSRVLLWGPTGTGKTHKFHDVVNALKDKGELDYSEKITITDGFEDIDFLTYILPDTTGIRYVERSIISTLREASKGKKVAICLDELNRGSRSFMNFVLTFLDGVDGDNYVLNNFIKDEKIVIPSENLIVYATMNIGGKYTGTSALDEALMDRFSIITHVTYNIENEKKIMEEAFGEFAKNAISVVSKIRGLGGDLSHTISTRGVKVWANDFLNSTRTREDFRNTFLNTLLYRLVDVDEFGNPTEESLIMVMGKLNEEGF